MADYIKKEAMRDVIRKTERLYGAKGLGWVEMAMDKLPTIPAPQWISVKDRLPEDAGDVLVVAFWHKKYQVLTGWHSLGGWLVTAGNEERPLDVTHWMPMPEPPDKRYKCRYADDNGVCSKLSGNGEIIYCVEGPCPYDMPEGEDDG